MVEGAHAGNRLREPAGEGAQVSACGTEALLDDVLDIVEKAGSAIVRLAAKGPLFLKSHDGSPVTRADLAANEVVVEGLRALSPHPIVSEESLPAAAEEAGDGPFWLVDPLDGTKEYLAGNGEFTVNVALVEGGEPVIGVVFAPAFGNLYWAAADKGAYRNGKRIFNGSRRSALIAVESRSHGDPGTDDFCRTNGIAERKTCGSSLKFCLLAEGTADVYPRFAGSSEWDTAAGHLVAREGGCRVIETATGRELRYGKPGWRNNAFVAFRADLRLG
jgi:3'(2'), 5'-bisphosphate nucleotidase